MQKKRLDEILIEKGVAADRGEAFVVVTEGRVFVNGQKAVSPSQIITPDARLEVRGQQKYVGRGAYKLKAALEKFSVNVRNKICVDIGAATGGFTQILLEAGAKKVYAIDTARGKLDLKLRQNPKVVVMDGQDIRDLESLPEKIDIAVIDVSLIPLKEILPALMRLLKPKAEVIALFKPQYETRDPKILKKGIVFKPEARKKLLADFLSWAKTNGWQVLGHIESPIRGAEGNTEYLVYLQSKD